MADAEGLHLVNCTIERGGFSSERTFEIPLADGGKAVGTAHPRHLLTDERKPLSDDVPAFGETIHGFVKCRVVRQVEDNSLLVDVPSFDLIHVPYDAVAAMGVPE